MLIIKRCKPKTEKQSGIALWKQQSAVLLAALLLVFQCTLLATPTYAATTNQESNIIQRFFERLFPPSVSPVPEPKKNDSKKPSVLSEKDPISPKAQPLDLTDLEQRIASLENQLIANTQYSSIPTSTLDTTASNLIRNSSFEASRGDKPRQWNYIYDSTENNTKQSPEGIRSGKYGLKFQGQTSTSGQGIDLGISQPETETTPQRTYTLSAYVKHTNVNNDTDVRKPTTANNTTIRLGFWDKYNNKPGPMKTILLSGTKDWYRISTTVETTGIITDYANWYPMIEVRGLKSGAAVYIDDVQLEEGSVLTLFDSAVAGWSSFGSSLGDGSVLATTTGTLYPAENGIGSLGTTSNRFRDLYLSKATINENGDLNLEGSASVGSLTVNGETNLKGSLKLNNLAYTFPATQGAENTILINDGTGALTWGTFGAASVTPDSLDFAQFVDNMTLDADSSINLNNSGTPHDLRFYNSNSGAEMLFLDGSTGRVGIGTAEPIQALDVSGSVNVSDAYLIRGNPILKTSGGSSTAGNILLGLYAGNSDVDSVANVFIGYQAGYSNTVGYSNTFIGRDAGYASTGNQNTFIGRDAGINLASGGNNTLLGHSSGRGVTSGTGYTLLGTGANAETGLINATAIGYQAKVATSNSMVLGCVSGCTGGTTVSVGIGTTAPAYRLDVIGTARFAPTLDSISGLFVNSSGNVGIGTSSPTSALDVAGTTWLRGAAGGTSGLYVDSSGNVGIGTTLPASLLDVAGTTWLRGASGGTSGLFVNSSGNVGIGTINPGAKLHISNTSPTAGGTELIRLSADYAHLGVVGRGGFLSFWDTSSIQKEISRISSVVTSGNRAGFTFSTYNGSGAIEKMRIDGNGNVGIGTTAPAYKLDVNGDINTTGDIRKNGTLYNNPDYVFEPDYDLMSMSDLKTFVSINKHLPGVPSSEDVRRDGVKLFEQTRLNLEKTEEAYLYLFDLDNRLNALSLPQQPPETTTVAIAEDFELDMVALNAELEALKDQMLTLDERLEIVEEQTDEIASMSAAIKELNAEVELLKSTQTIASVSATLAESDLEIADGTNTTIEDLTVTGKANVFDLAVLKSISTGLLNINGLVCENQDTCRATIATLNGTLALQPEATGNLEFMAGKVVIDTKGDMKIDGKLTVGEVVTEKIKSKSVETKSVVLGDDVTMTSGTSAPTGTCQTGTMYVWNDKTKDEALIFVCTKKKWQEVTTATPVSNTSPTPTISVSPTPTPSDVIHIPSSDGGTAVPASQTE